MHFLLPSIFLSVYGDDGNYTWKRNINLKANLPPSRLMFVFLFSFAQWSSFDDLERSTDGWPGICIMGLVIASGERGGMWVWRIGGFLDGTSAPKAGGKGGIRGRRNTHGLEISESTSRTIRL